MTSLTTLIITEEMCTKKNEIGVDVKTYKILKDNEVVFDTLPNGKTVAVGLPGEISKIQVDESDTRLRTNYSESYNINFRDGDESSSRRNFLDVEETTGLSDNSSAEETRLMYNSPNLKDTTDLGEFRYDSKKRTSLINDQARVYKGGSWKDRAYWLDPAQRKFYPQGMSTDFIGFRCAMSRLGAKNGYGTKKRN